MRKLVSLIVLVCVAGSAQATGVSIRVADDTAGVSVVSPLRGGHGSIEAGYLYREGSNNLFTFGLFADGERGVVRGRLGGKAFYANLRNDDGGGLALGGDLGIPLSDLVTFQAGAYFSPSPTTFGDLDRYREYTAALDLTLFPNAGLEVGWGRIELRHDETGRTFRMLDGAFFRMKLRF